MLVDPPAKGIILVQYSITSSSAIPTPSHHFVFLNFKTDGYSIVIRADFNAVHISFTITLLTTPTWFISLTFLIRSVSALPYFTE